MDLEKRIDEIIQNYYVEVDDCYTQYRHNKEEKEFQMDDELKELLDENHIEYKISITEGFDSAGYGEDFLALAYINPETKALNLKTVRLEYF